MKKEQLKDKYVKYGLTKDDVFKHQHYTIITRAGIDKIQAAQNITIDFDLVNLSNDHSHCLIKATATMGDKTIQTFGEAAPKNNKNAYVVSMAEKRAMSRAVLKLAGFYQHGVFSEDEADDFKRN